MICNSRHLLFSVVLFCLGTVFQFNGVFGDPFMQQMAFVVVWLPVVLALIFGIRFEPKTSVEQNNNPTLPTPA